MKRWEWTCKWCGKTEHSSCMASDFKLITDKPYERDHCYHCLKDSDGNVDWQLYRQGDNGYYGDGDFCWNGSWKGEKPVSTCYPMDDLRPYRSWGSGHYGLPIIKLYVTIDSNYRLGHYDAKNRRPSKWSAKLSICHGTSMWSRSAPQGILGVKKTH